MPRKIKALLEEGGFLIVVHSNADVDAIASAAALFHTYKDCAIAAPGGISRQGKALAEKLGLEISTVKLLVAPPRVVVVDAAGPEMVDAQIPVPSIIIDHHKENDAWKGHICLIDPSKPSCSEVVLALIKSKLTEVSARDLLYGIVADTGGFRHAATSTFKDFALLLDRSGENAEEAFAFFQETPEDPSQRIARLKAAQRLRFVQEGDVVIGTSHIGAFEAEACRMMLAMGCDVALVGRQEGKEFRVSGRCKPHVRISLADIMGQVGLEFGGTGGGHDCAAGLSGRGDAEAAVNACASRVVEALRKGRGRG